MSSFQAGNHVTDLHSSVQPDHRLCPQAPCGCRPAIPPLSSWSACSRCCSPTFFPLHPLQLLLQTLQPSQVPWGLTLVGVRIAVLPVGRPRSRKVLGLPQITKPAKSELGPNPWYSDSQSEFCLLPVPSCLRICKIFAQNSQSCLHFHSACAFTGLRRKAGTGVSGLDQQNLASLWWKTEQCVLTQSPSADSRPTLLSSHCFSGIFLSPSLHTCLSFEHFVPNNTYLGQDHSNWCNLAS